MKISITPRKPRNPLVAAAHFRRAGNHQPRGNSARQQCARELRRELERLGCTKPSP